MQSGGGAPLDPKVPVTQLDNRHLVVRWRDEAPSAAEPSAATAAAADSRHRAFPSLDEITNRVFDDLLKGKADGTFDDFGVIDLDQDSSKVSAVTGSGGEARSWPAIGCDIEIYWRRTVAISHVCSFADFVLSLM